jgi:hypothetical protein
MKISRAGVWTIIIMLLLVPLLADLTQALTFGFGPTGKRLFLFAYKVYLVILPIYIVYVIVAKAVIRLWDKWIKY